MQEKHSSVFRQTSLDRMNSPEALNDYIRISGPGIWLVVVSALLLVAAGLIWAVMGKVPTTLSAVAVADREGSVFQAVVSEMAEDARPEARRVYCWVPADDADEIRVGDEVTCDHLSGRVGYVFEIPWAYSEIETLYTSQYMLHQMGLGDWSRMVLVDLDETDSLEEGMYPVTIITGTEQPIRFLVN